MFRRWLSKYFSYFLAGAILMIAIYAMMFELTKYPVNWKFSYSIITLGILNAGLAFSVFKNNWMLTRSATELGTWLPCISVVLSVVSVIVNADPKFTIFLVIAIGFAELFLVSPDKE
mgnify:CR=1 FL=1